MQSDGVVEIDGWAANTDIDVNRNDPDGEDDDEDD